MSLAITRFSIQGQNLGRLTLLEAVHTDALDGTDQLTVTCYEELQKHDRLVWRDRQGEWHEHIVDEPIHTHDGDGRPATMATCINSIAETWDDYVLDVRPANTSAQAALERILVGTRWSAGSCTQEGLASHTFYHISVREAISELLETWGGELVTVIGTNGSGKSNILVQTDTSKVWQSENYILGGESDSSEQQNAISVGDVSAHIGSEDIWVTGYIVGGDLTSSGKTVKTSGIGKNTHLALADRASVTAKASCLAVELPQGKVREALNLPDHPDLIGRRVSVKGNLVEKYFGTVGMKSTSDYEIK